MAKKINTEMELRKVKLANLIPYENNPRNNDEAVPDVKESMTQTGYNSPIIVGKDMVILAGHTRLKALLDAGVEEAPVIIVNRTAAQAKKYRLLDNKTAEKAGWDFGKLDVELEGMDFEGFDFGFTLNDIDIESFFTPSEPKQETGMETDAHGGKVQCPHCGEWFTP